MHNLGETRSRYRHDHLLQTPDTFVFAPLPGMVKTTAAIHAGPAMGADFTQYTAVMEAGGVLGPAVGSRFFFVLEGEVMLDADGTKHTLRAKGFAAVPPDLTHTIQSSSGAKLAVIEKKFVLQNGVALPKLLVGDESTLESTPLLGDEDLRVRTMIPDDAGYDFAVNTMSYVPGGSLSMVEVHVMEHGLLMLEGGGIYKLGDSWYPVKEGDFIWMAPYCPQWFGALGKTQAKYLIYKDWNRHPLAAEVR